MTLLGLAGIMAASLFGPLLATPRRARVPVVIGELAIGVLLGNTGLRWVHPGDPTLTFMAQAGFALVMLIAGSHVPLGNPALRKAFGRGLLLAAVTGVVAVPVAAALSAMAHTHHTALYAVLLASSSAAVVMPIISDEGLSGDRVLTLMAQVAIADTACIVALPLAAEPSRAARAAVGTVIVLAVAGLMFIVLRELTERDLIAKLHAASVRRTFGVEMRLSLAALFGLAGLAVNVHVSVMLAGFASGLVLAALGTPRRLASQLFAVTEGFLGPVFLVWLGSSLDLRALAHHPRLLALTVGLAAATLAIHALARLFGQPMPLAILAGAQLGVPVAAVALGTRTLLLAPGRSESRGRLGVRCGRRPIGPRWHGTHAGCDDHAATSTPRSGTAALRRTDDADHALARSTRNSQTSGTGSRASCDGAASRAAHERPGDSTHPRAEAQPPRATPADAQPCDETDSAVERQGAAVPADPAPGKWQLTARARAPTATVIRQEPPWRPACAAARARPAATPHRPGRELPRRRRAPRSGIARRTAGSSRRRRDATAP
jgi:Kef-type K+ transport system membrane component KefB